MPGRPSSGEIIFHHPVAMAETPGKGSQLRPGRMVDAFRELGYEVVEVTGPSSRRVPRMRALRQDIERGRRFEFCYAESANVPTALSDPNHLPMHPIADPLFFRSLHRAGVPVGLFYRDIHWRFSQYRDVVPLWKRAPTVALFAFDLAWYARWVDVLYLPHLEMARHVPGSARFDTRELPPGCVTTGGIGARSQDPQVLDLVYVGSISPPHCDITPLLRAVRATEGARLTVSFPAAERGLLGHYPAQLLEGVELLNATGTEVEQLYAAADVLCLVFEPHPYRAFAMPVKLFEAIGHGLPCLADSDTAAGDFVRRNGFGWPVEPGQLPEVLEHLSGDRGSVEAARDRVARGAAQHTWTERAATVASQLSEVDTRRRRPAPG